MAADSTHAALCQLAARWLKRPQSAGGHGCHVALSEARPSWAGECPDAIGFRAGHDAGSVVVECKVSRADFLADRGKPHRQPGSGMGTWRYYMAPAGLIAVDELPPRWGLLEVNSRKHVKPLAGPAVSAGHWAYYAAALEAYRHEIVDSRLEFELLVRMLGRLGDVESMNLAIREANARSRQLERELVKLRERNDKLRAQAFASQYASKVEGEVDG